MASLVLSIAGSWIGGQIGGTVLGMTAASIGATVGSAVGGIVDSYLLSSMQHSTGPRLTDVSIQTSTEGAAIPRVDGYCRISGNVIWATRFKEKESTTGGKGFGGPEVTNYSYSISVAVGLCEGVVPKLGRIWADGNLLDVSTCTIRFYHGTDSQTADPLIEEIEGAGNTPAYRGLCYLVFEDLELTAFGNRIPQFQVELVRSISSSHVDSLEYLLPSVNLIPGAGEFVYAPVAVTEDDRAGTTTQLNANNTAGVADYTASVDELQALVPNLKAVSLVVGWFGTDLRAGNCTVRPGVEQVVRNTYPENWTVNGVARANAYLVSLRDDRPAYGGTPTDECVVAAIADLKSRGLKITFYPFILMDVPAGNSLPNPYSNNAATAGQAAYPWRGRITVSPAPGYTGTVDKTSAGATQITAFFGTAAASNFAVSGTTVSWTGGSDWGYRRMILHYAKLCVAAGGVDAFLIGSELRGLTQSRSAAATYPAVAALKQLAADVKAIVGSTCKVGYAADWSEYNNHQTGDAASAVQFNLDPLWSDSSIDFIGIDNYMPLADWRDGIAHLDYDSVNGPTSPRDRDYLQRNIRGGEDYDWYYASQAARDAQTRTAIADATYSKPWVWRAKDIWNWWSNFHYDRVSGTESGSHTAWVPQSKPIRFTELGCPAVDKGANEPNVFYDPKSSESALPYYSNGQRDDLMQRAFLEAHLNFWASPTNNPTSTVYSGTMVDTATIAAWCWDARPFPFFPLRSDLWGDTPNYELGHWLNGRVGCILLSDLVAEICDESKFFAYDVSDLAGLVTGFVRNTPMSARDQLTPLMAVYFFDGVETQGQIRFLMRGRPVAPAINAGDFVIDPDGNPDDAYNFARAQDDDLPVTSRITYIDAGNSYQNSTYTAKRLVGNSNKVMDNSVPLVMDRSQAVGVGDRLLQETWITRETGTFALAPRHLAYDPGDDLQVTAGGRLRRVRISQIDDTTSRAIQSVLTDPSIYEDLTGPARLSGGAGVTPAAPGRALAVFMDIPALTDTDFARAWAPHIAVYADPWPGKLYVLKSATDSNYQLDTTITKASRVGTTMYDLYSGPTARWDRINSLYVQLYSGTLSSVDEITVLNGANAIAVQNADGGWEVLQFANAALVGDRQYLLSKLLRGQMGSEGEMRSPVAAGARVVVIDDTLTQASLAQSQISFPFSWMWGPSGKPLSDSSYQKTTYQFRGIGLRPYAPCHVRFSWNGTANLTISWKRRDRNPASDSWDQAEIPLTESNEAYDFEILNGTGTAVVRTFTSLSSATAVYSATQQTTDFGGTIPNPLIVKVYQLSPVFGRGQGVRESLWTR